MTVIEELNIGMFIVFGVYPLIAAIVLIVIMILKRKSRGKK